jgi:hypothetical protein
MMHIALNSGRFSAFSRIQVLGHSYIKRLKQKPSGLKHPPKSQRSNILFNPTRIASEIYR